MAPKAARPAAFFHAASGQVWEEKRRSCVGCSLSCEATHISAPESAGRAANTSVGSIYSKFSTKLTDISLTTSGNQLELMRGKFCKTRFCLRTISDILCPGGQIKEFRIRSN